MEEEKQTMQTPQQQTKAPAQAGQTEKTIAVNVDGKSRQVVIGKTETTAHILDRLNLKDYQLSMGSKTVSQGNVLHPNDVVFDNVVENEVLTAVSGRPQQPVRK
jgi:hypothetical protein